MEYASCFPYNLKIYKHKKSQKQFKFIIRFHLIIRFVQFHYVLFHIKSFGTPYSNYVTSYVTEESVKMFLL